MAYCVEADLLLEGLPLGNNPGDLMKPKYIEAAADEMDIILGQIYAIPIVYPDTPQNRLTGKFLKQVNSWLATGRIIIAFTITREDQQLNAYGRQLVNGALKALNDLVAGLGSLPGVEFSNQYEDSRSRILTYQLNPTSLVEDFEQVVFGVNGFTARSRGSVYDPRMR